MNIVQIHERVKFWVDIVATTRFEPEDIDNSVNIAIENKFRESYDQDRLMNKSDSFQRVQRVRDELGLFVKPIYIKNDLGDIGLSISGNKISLTDSIQDYGWLLSIRVKDDSQWYEVYPGTYDRKNIINKNPFRKVRKDKGSKLYYYETEGKWEIDHNLSSITDAEIYYLAIPPSIQWGTEYDNSKEFQIGNKIICLSDVVFEDVVGTEKNYKIGDEITITSSSKTSINSGSVLYEYTDIQTRKTTHEEISRRGAINCLITANENEKVKVLMNEIITS
jgi:hypothetical protein